MDELRFYAVRNSSGQWFHRKGYGGYGDTWVGDLKKARIYVNIGGARAVSGWFANNYPDYGVPEIVVFKAEVEEVLDEAARRRKAEEKEVEREEKREKKRANKRLEQAKKELEKAKERVEELRE